MTATQVMDQLKKKGSENIKKIFLNHGAKEPLFGVKVADLKVIQKKVKKDYQLSMDLYNTGNYDAMYLAVAEAFGLRLVTADDRLIRKTEQGAGRYRGMLLPLSDIVPAGYSA